MKTKGFLKGCLIVAVFAVSFAFKPTTKRKPAKCLMAVTYSELAFGQFKKAYKASTIDDAKKSLKKGSDQIKQASAYAAQCQCVLAETYSLTAYTTAKKAYEKGDDLESIKSDSKKAMDLSLDAMKEAQGCNK